MLKRFHLEVEASTVAEAYEALNEYESVLLDTEAENYAIGGSTDQLRQAFGYEVTDEVIAMGQGGGYYVGSRAVRLRRLDTRQEKATPPPPPEPATGSSSGFT